MRKPRVSVGSVAVLLVCAACVLAIPGVAAAKNPQARQMIAIPQQAAASAVSRLVELTDFQILYPPQLLRGVRASAVRGSMTPREALAGLLRNSGIEVVDTGPGAATLRAVTRPARREDEARDIPSVEVTSRKFSERLIDVPIAVSVFTGKTLDRQGVADVAAALQDVPGVSAYDTGFGFSKISIRGIATSLGGNENGYYLDDLPFTGVTAPIAPDVRAWDLQRVEVLRGPQGTLFGEGSMGGTIRTLTNNAQLNRFAVASQAGLSQTQGGGVNHAAKLMLNVPVITDLLALRLAVTDEDASGWIDDPAQRRRNINPEAVRTARLRALLRPLDNLSINASYWRYRGDFSSGNKENDRGVTPQAGTEQDSRPSYTLKGISATYDLEQVSVFYGYSQNRYALPQTGLYVGAPFRGDIDIGVAAHELRLSSAAAAAWRWTVGVYRRDSTRRDLVDFADLALRQLSTTTSRAASVFGELTYTMPYLPLEASLGLRHFRDRLSGADVNSGAAAAASDATFSSNNPRFSLAYRPRQDWQLYASASKGFRSGQRQLSGFEQVAAANNVTLPSVIKPDTIWTYEAGTKISLLERRLNLELAAYHSNWKDVAVRIPLGSTGLSGLVNSDGIRSNGLDASISYAFNRAFTATVGGGYVDARYAGSVVGTGIRDGSPVDDVPRLTLHASGEYSFAAGQGWSGLARAGLQYASPHLASAFPANQKGDAVANLHGRLALGKGAWSIALFGDNLANDHGAISYRSVTALDAGGSEAYAPRLRPRTIGLELTVQFEQ